MTPLTLTVTDALGHMMLIRADMLSAIAHKTGPGTGRGMLLAMGKCIFETQEDPSALINAIRTNEKDTGPNGMNVTVQDQNGKMTYLRAAHVIAITPMPIDMRQQALKRGQIVQGTVLWTLSGHGIVTREPQDAVIKRMMGAKHGIIPTFEPRVAGPTSPVGGNSNGSDAGGSGKPN